MVKTHTGAGGHTAQGLCSRQAETRLWKLRDTDRNARDELVRRHLPLAMRLAHKYRNRGESVEDLEQVAALGLLSAIIRYDPSTKVPFAGFAAPTVDGELKRHFRDRTSMVRVPRSLQEDIMAVDHFVDVLRAERHANPSHREIAALSGIDQIEVERALAAKKQRAAVSLNQPVRNEGQMLEETLGEPDTRLELIEEREELRSVIRSLEPMDRYLLRLRYIDDLTQTEIAERFGCSQMQISRLLKRSTQELLRRTGHRGSTLH